MSLTPHQWLTVYVIVGTVLLLGVYDVAMSFYDSEATISKVLWACAGEHPVIALVLGILIGHALWPVK